MIGLGALGVVVDVFGTVAGWIFVGQIATASDDSLEVTVQTLSMPSTTRSTSPSPNLLVSGSPAKFLSER